MNDVGVAYMLIEELPGTPLLLLDPKEDQLRKVYDKYAGILCKLYRFPLDQVRCLSFGPGEHVEIGPVIGDRTGTFPCMGPFRNAPEYYGTFAERYLDMICDRQIFTSYPVDAYLVFKFLGELARHGEWNKFEPELDDGPCFLKHMDDKGDHILMDDDYNITGIIDWTFARVVPVYEAFGPSLLTANMGDVFNGRPGCSGRDKLMADATQPKCGDLSRFAYGRDCIRRYSFGLGLGMSMSRDEVCKLSKCIIATATEDYPEIDWDLWRQHRLSEWTDDARLQALLRDENTVHNQMFDNVDQTPRFSTCSAMGCGRPGVRGRSCSACLRHFCARHQSKDYHKCPSSSELDDESWEKSINDEVAELLSKIDTQELVKLATRLNNGVHCVFEPGKHIGVGAIMGCANYHGWLTFDNGERWTVRVPRTGFSDVADEFVEYLVASEYTTLKFLESTQVPAPRAFGYGIASDPENHVGVSFILQQFMPGKPFYAYQASPAQKRRVLEQVADIMIEISKKPVPLAGSFVMKDGQVEVSAVASNRFVALGTYGPFTTSTEYLTSITEQYMDLIADGQVYPEHPVEAFLFYRFLRKNVNSLTALNSGCTERFFLKHVDDKGDHLLVDDDFNITGVIDWQFARTVPPAEAFGPSYLTADLGALYSSRGGMTDDDRILATALKEHGSGDLARYAESDEIMRRLHHGLASGLSRDEARDVLKGMVEAVEGRPVRDIDAWVVGQSRECWDDPRWAGVQGVVSQLGK